MILGIIALTPAQEGSKMALLQRKAVVELIQSLLVQLRAHQHESSHIVVVNTGFIGVFGSEIDVSERFIDKTDV